MFPLANLALFLLISLRAEVSNYSSLLLPGQGNRKFFFKILKEASYIKGNPMRGNTFLNKEPKLLILDTEIYYTHIYVSFLVRRI